MPAAGPPSEQLKDISMARVGLDRSSFEKKVLSFAVLVATGLTVWNVAFNLSTKRPIPAVPCPIYQSSCLSPVGFVGPEFPLSPRADCCIDYLEQYVVGTHMRKM
jgi:hypothetical protein